MRIRFLLPLALLALAAFAFTACGGDDDVAPTPEVEREDAPEPAPEVEANGESVVAEGGEVTVEADPGGDLSYVQTEILTEPGELRVSFVNTSAVPHDFGAEQDGQELARTSVFSEGEESVTFDVEPGEYEFYCSVGGHRASGMEGTIVVEQQ